MTDKTKRVCCICRKEYEGYGNNPQPVVLIGRCCDECNRDIIIPTRIRYAKVQSEDEEAKQRRRRHEEAANETIPPEWRDK